MTGLNDTQKLEMACEWSDYRKDYGCREKDLHTAHAAFCAGYAAALGDSLEPGPLR